MAKLDSHARDGLTDAQYGFSEHRKEPIGDAQHVRDAIARFDQVKDVTDADRDAAWKRIKKASKKFDVAVAAADWRDLGKGKSR